MLIPSVWLTAAAILYTTFTGIFLLATYLKNNGIADIAWGLGFVLVTVVALLASGNPTARDFLLLGMVSAWGFRLAAHIYDRNRGKSEDFRYKKWREEWGDTWQVLLRSFLQVFMLQATLLLVVAAPLIVGVSHPTASNPAFPTWLDLLGFGIWAFGLTFETIGDLQLRAFKKDPTNKGKILKSGLWAYTRHPNYFGEAVLWWGVWLVALNFPAAWWTVIGPITITILVRFVSGVPMLEKKYDQRGDQEWLEYKAKTNTFIPGPSN